MVHYELGLWLSWDYIYNPISQYSLHFPQKTYKFYGFTFQGLTKFYEAVMQGILRHVDFSIVKCVILASPGFVRDQFYDYMMQQAIKTDNKLLIDNKSKFLLVKASSGFKHSLKGETLFLTIILCGGLNIGWYQGSLEVIFIYTYKLIISNHYTYKILAI